MREDAFLFYFLFNFCFKEFLLNVDLQNVCFKFFSIFLFKLFCLNLENIGLFVCSNIFL